MAKFLQVLPHGLGVPVPEANSPTKNKVKMQHAYSHDVPLPSNIALISVPDWMVMGGIQKLIRTIGCAKAVLISDQNTRLLLPPPPLLHQLVG